MQASTCYDVPITPSTAVLPSFSLLTSRRASGLPPRPLRSSIGPACLCVASATLLSATSEYRAPSSCCDQNELQRIPPSPLLFNTALVTDPAPPLPAFSVAAAARGAWCHPETVAAFALLPARSTRRRETTVDRSLDAGTRFSSPPRMAQGRPGCRASRRHCCPPACESAVVITTSGSSSAWTIDGSEARSSARGPGGAVARGSGTSTGMCNVCGRGSRYRWPERSSSQGCPSKARRREWGERGGLRTWRRARGRVRPPGSPAPSPHERALPLASPCYPRCFFSTHRARLEPRTHPIGSTRGFPPPPLAFLPVVRPYSPPPPRNRRKRPVRPP